MGYYINKVNGVMLPALGKAHALIDLADAQPIDEPKEWVENLVCVVNNGLFEAAAYIPDTAELIDFTMPHDYRGKQWMIVPNAKELAK